MKKNVFIRPLFILCFNSLTYSKTIKSLHIAVYDENNDKIARSVFALFAPAYTGDDRHDTE